jgi:hypothetical protein
MALLEQCPLQQLGHSELIFRNQDVHPIPIVSERWQMILQPILRFE